MSQHKRIKIQLQLEVEVDAFACAICQREGHGQPHELELITEEDARRRGERALRGDDGYQPIALMPGWHNRDNRLPSGWVMVSWETAGTRSYTRETRIERVFCPDCRTKAEAALPPAVCFDR